MTRNMLVGLLLATFSTATFAEPRTATITITSGDFSSPVARAKLNRRIGTAVEQVCGSYGTIESYQMEEMDACWKAASADVARRLATVGGNLRVQLAAH